MRICLAKQRRSLRAHFASVSPEANGLRARQGHSRVFRETVATVRLFSTAAAAHWMDSKFAAPKPFANAPSHRAPSRQQQRSSHSVVPVSSWFLLDYGHRFYFSFFLN